MRQKRILAYGYEKLKEESLITNGLIENHILIVDFKNNMYEMP